MPDAPATPAARFKTLTEQLHGVYDRFLALNQKQKAKVIAGAAAFCYFCFIMVCIVYGMTGVKKAMSSQRNVLLYMDTMPSDLAALRYLIKRSDIHVTGIVLNIVGFGMDVRMTYDNLQKFLKLLAMEGSRYAASIPVYYGDHVASINAQFDANYVLPMNATVMPNSTSSCTYNRVISPEVNGGSYTQDLLFGAGPLLTQITALSGSQQTTPTPQYAQPQFIASQLLARPATLLSFSSLTDVSALLNILGPKVSSAITDVFVAGGAINCPGDVQTLYRLNSAAELNVFFDPSAAQQVLQQQPSLSAYVVTSDAARSLQFPPAVWNALVSSRVASPSSSSSSISSASIVATGLASQWGALSYTADNRAPAELLAAVLFAEPGILSKSTASISFVNVVAGVSLSLDGTTTLSSTGSSASVRPKTVILGNSDPVSFWNNIMTVDRLPFPVQN